MTPPNSWGFKVLLMGPSGTGKTSSLRTLLDPRIEAILGHPLKIYAAFTEPSPMNVLQDILPQIVWAYVPPAIADWNTMITVGKSISVMSNNALQGLSKGQAGAYNQFLNILTLCNNFTDHNGKTYGDISTFGDDSVFWLDSLTGLNKMAKRLVAGGRPILTQPDWGVGMEYLQNFIDTLTCGLKCHFALCAHTEYSADEVHGLGQTKILVSTLGRKLAPVLPTTFSDVVLTAKAGDKFTWATTNGMTDLRNTYLPIKDSLQPSFVQIVEEWKRRNN